MESNHARWTFEFYKPEYQVLSCDGRMPQRVICFPLDYFMADIRKLVVDEKIIRKLTDDETELLDRIYREVHSILRPEISRYCLEVRASNIGEGVKMAYIPISALRLYKRGSVGISLFVLPKERMAAPLPPLSFMQSHPGSPIYSMGKEEVKTFKQLCNRLNELSSLEDQKLGLALRRYNLSFSVPEFEDKLIDYMIALEALFLSGESEKGFRLRTYMTTFLGNNSPSRMQEIWNYVKKAYELRSQVVHGTKPLPSKISVRGLDYIVSIEDFVFKIEEYTRDAIKRYIEIKAKSKDFNLQNFVERALYRPYEKTETTLTREKV